MKYLLTATIAALAIILIFALKKVRLRHFILSALSGIAVLFAANFIMSFFETRLPLTPFTLCCAAMGGIPGVIFSVILFTVFGMQM